MRSTTSETLRRGLGLLAFAVSVSYLTWRLWTINTDALWLSVPFYLLELTGLFSFGLFIYSVWDTDHLRVAEPRHDTANKVAILIPTYNEDPEILLPTVAAALAVDLPHETWVLDDGKRPWVEEMAREVGAHYLIRPDNSHAKAGNLNHALNQIDADLVAILDADHVPKRNLLRNTVGYFDDPYVALVQTPQAFYNNDSFEDVGSSYQEEELFYRVIQPGKNRWNAAFWCGTSAVVRVDALRSVGGVATESLTEDLHTTLRLHRQGWSTIFHNEVLAQGLAPQSYDEYLVQRKRWAAGAMQVLRGDNPFTSKGLTGRQKLAYAATLSGWMEGWRTVAYLMVAFLVVLTGAIPLHAPVWVFAAFFLTTLATQQAAMRLLSQGYHRTLPGMLFDWYRVPASLRAALQLVWPKASPFRVTPKGRTGTERVRTRLPISLVSLVCVAFVGAFWFFASLLGVTPVSYSDTSTVALAMFFLGLNAATIMLAIGRATRLSFASERRGARRFNNDSLPILLGSRKTKLISPSLSGGYVPAAAEFDVGLTYTTDEVSMLFESDDSIVELKAHICRRGGTDLSLEFVEGQWQGRGELSRQLFS